MASMRGRGPAQQRTRDRHSADIAVPLRRIAGACWVCCTCAHTEMTVTPVDAGVRSYADISGGPREDAPRAQTQVSADDIRGWVRRAIYEPDAARPYKINAPPTDRPVRIYADGVYDLFHYAHALQLRQAKLSFPRVHLIVGVVSSSLCETHKNRPLLESYERYEAVRQCRWVDEVLEDAPWVIGQDLIDELKIDYVAHDEIPYAVSGAAASDDVYDWLKRQGKFLPTRRTEGVSTSELIARIVRTYRAGDLNGKLTKMGEADLTSAV